MPTTWSCWPSRYSVSTVSSVSQTIRLGGNIKPPPTDQPDGSATNFYELDTQPLPRLSSFGRLPTAPTPDLFDRDEDRMPDLTFDVLRQVALARGVLDQDHLADADHPAL